MEKPRIDLIKELVELREKEDYEAMEEGKIFYDLFNDPDLLYLTNFLEGKNYVH